MRNVYLFASLFALAVAAQDRPRVFINESQSWQIAGRSGGSRGQTAEIYKTFGASCPAVVMTNTRDRADFIVEFDHEGGKGLLRHDNKIAVFNKAGDMVYSGSTRSLGSSVKDACRAMVR